MTLPFASSFHSTTLADVLVHLTSQVIRLIGPLAIEIDRLASLSVFLTTDFEDGSAARRETLLRVLQRSAGLVAPSVGQACELLGATHLVHYKAVCCAKAF